MSIENWNVVVTPKADKQLQKLPEAIQDIVLEALEALAAEGVIPKHWDVKKTNDHEYRLRINYRYRMRYKVEPKRILIEVFYIGHRKEAYK